jgi:hypothetical protein
MRIHYGESMTGSRSALFDGTCDGHDNEKSIICVRLRSRADGLPAQLTTDIS